MATQGQVPVTPADRLSFTLFVAVAVHATAILGIGFAPERDSVSSPDALEVTIAHQRSDEAPEDPDFLAQADQEGSGDQEEVREVTTDREADFEDPEIDPVQLQPPGLPDRPERPPEQLVVTTRDLSHRTMEAEEPEETREQDAPEAPEPSLEELSREISSLQARLDEQRQAYAQRPRVRRITSVSARAHYEAAYIDAFRRKVEETGTRNFPHQALSRDTFGNVRLMVALEPDGEVRDMEILQSSGYPFLDEAAKQSVRMSAPFEPFTEEMRDNADILEIIRTWRFERGERVVTH